MYAAAFAYVLRLIEIIESERVKNPNAKRGIGGF